MSVLRGEGVVANLERTTFMSFTSMPLPVYAVWGGMAWRSLATMPEHRGDKHK